MSRKDQTVSFRAVGRSSESLWQLISVCPLVVELVPAAPLLSHCH